MDHISLSCVQGPVDAPGHKSGDWSGFAWLCQIIPEQHAGPPQVAAGSAMSQIQTTSTPDSGPITGPPSPQVDPRVDYS